MTPSHNPQPREAQPSETGNRPVLEAPLPIGTGGVTISPEDAQLVHSIRVAKRLGRKAAHDFNNIMAVIQGFAGILQNRLQSDEANRGIAEQIEVSASEALKLTNWLSTFANNRPAELVPLDLNKLLEECLSTLSYEKPSGIQLQLDLAPEPLLLIGDEVQLEQVCRELWFNTIEAMPKGGEVHFQTTIEEIPASNNPVGGNSGTSFFCRLRVSDTGSGMDLETCQSMFEPFFSTKRGKARGLGLSTVYDTVRAHEGFVQVSSEPGQGTHVDVYLPAQQRLDSSDTTESSCRKLLIVDDEELIRVMVQHMLKPQGCDVIGANSGDEALDLFQKAGDIKVVILDMNLPGLSGTEIFDKLRELDDRIKVIISTGDPHHQSVHDLMAQGAFGVLSKPFSAEHLKEVVNQALD